MKLFDMWFWKKIGGHRTFRINYKSQIAIKISIIVYLQKKDLSNFFLKCN